MGGKASQAANVTPQQFGAVLCGLRRQLAIDSYKVEVVGEELTGIDYIGDGNGINNCPGLASMAEEEGDG
eukprot:6149074-Prorocentrum_lima.AAC.1